MPENDSEAVAEFIRTRGITVAQLPASCRPKALLLRLTGLRRKSTQLHGTAYAEHKPPLLTGGGHF
jgi:hypothetical protein